MASSSTKKAEEKNFQETLVSQLVTLSTSGFGLVAALAWNNVIQDLVKNYIQTYFPKNAGIISELIYAVLITMIAVTVTYQLSRLAARLHNLKNRSS